MITRDDLKSILVSNAAVGIPADIEYDEQLVIDSFTLVWLKHALAEQHDVVIDPQHADRDELTSINQIFRYLSRCVPDRVAAEEIAGDG